MSERRRSQAAPSRRHKSALAVLEALARIAPAEGQHRDFYPEGSRTEFEFRMTQMMVLIVRRWRARVDEHLREIGQTPARWEALFAIAFSEGESTQSRLASRMGIEGPTLVRMLHSLEADGLVERVASAEDKRAKFLRLTPKGDKAVNDIARITNKLRSDMLADVDDDEIDQFILTIAKLFNKLD
jgi:MarR family transcriptional regulator for hemolysin